MKNKWYTVNEEKNFYDDMTGMLVGETPRTLILEFRLSGKLGGTQRVQFWRRSLVFDGEY
jgi:hypothetical protein